MLLEYMYMVNKLSCLCEFGIAICTRILKVQVFLYHVFHMKNSNRNCLKKFLKNLLVFCICILVDSMVSVIPENGKCPGRSNKDDYLEVHAVWSGAQN